MTSKNIDEEVRDFDPLMTQQSCNELKGQLDGMGLLKRKSSRVQKLFNTYPDLIVKDEVLKIQRKESNLTVSERSTVIAIAQFVLANDWGEKLKQKDCPSETL